ncbi:MAG TPA: GNAT family protein [Acidimicrobiales bacterium]
MLHGPRLDLRARKEEDVAVLHADLYDDVETRSRTDGSAWRPRPVASSPYNPVEPTEKVSDFTVVERATGEVVGATLLWWIDTHNRSAHIGVGLRPAWRGKGYGTEIVTILCRYAFTVLGLHRLQIETLADNDAMIATAKAAGFQLEGTTRQSSWVLGGFRDDVVFGLLAEDWIDPAAPR